MHHDVCGCSCHPLVCKTHSSLLKYSCCRLFSSTTKSLSITVHLLCVHNNKTLRPMLVLWSCLVFLVNIFPKVTRVLIGQTVFRFQILRGRVRRVQGSGGYSAAPVEVLIRQIKEASRHQHLLEPQIQGPVCRISWIV